MAGESSTSTPPVTRTSSEIEAELMSLPIRNEDDGEDGEGSPNSKPSPTSTSVDPDVAAAVRKGWVPKSDYTGDPGRWVDAKTFVERGERFNSNLQREVAMLKQKLESFEGTKAAFVKFHEETLQKKDEELSSAITKLRVQRSEAIGDGEHEAAVALEDRIELLQKERKEVKAIPADNDPAAPTPKPPGPNPSDPVLLEWIADGNEWFETDPQLRAYAVTVGEDLIAKGETIRGRKFLEKVAGIMAEEFPRKFAKPKSASITPPNPMEGSGGTSSTPARSPNGSKTERDLPDEDLQLMRQFIKEGWMTKEKFLAGYFSR